MGWIPRKSGDKPQSWAKPTYKEEGVGKSAPGQPEADKKTRKEYHKVTPREGRAWEAGDTGAKGKLNDV